MFWGHPETMRLQLLDVPQAEKVAFYFLTETKKGYWSFSLPLPETPPAPIDFANILLQQPFHSFTFYIPIENIQADSSTVPFESASNCQNFFSGKQSFSPDYFEKGVLLLQVLLRKFSQILLQ